MTRPDPKEIQGESGNQTQVCRSRGGHLTIRPMRHLEWVAMPSQVEAVVTVMAQNASVSSFMFHGQENDATANELAAYKYTPFDPVFVF